MSREIRTARYNPLMVVSNRFGYSSEDASRFRFLQFNILGRQLAPRNIPTRSVDVFRRAFENAGRSSALGSEEKSVAKFNESRILQGFDSFVKSDVFVIEASSSTESLVGFARTLVNIFDEGEDRLTTSSAADDHQRFAPARDKLAGVVSENENPLLPPSMFLISNLIEKYKEESDVIALPEPTGEEVGHQPESLFHLDLRGLEAAYGDDEPEYTMDMLIAVNPDYEGTDVRLDSGKRSFARGLETAYDDDEPEYTTDILIEVNPDHEKE